MIVVFELNLLPILKKKKKKKGKNIPFLRSEIKAKGNAIKCYLYVCPWVSNTVSLYSTMASWWKIHTLNSTAYAYVSQYEIRDIYMWNSFLSLAFWLRNAEWVLYQMVRLSRSEL